MTQEAHVWFWIRTRTPKRVWKKCMEFQKKRDNGKEETYFVDERTGTTRMVIFLEKCRLQFISMAAFILSTSIL